MKRIYLVIALIFSSTLAMAQTVDELEQVKLDALRARMTSIKLQADVAQAKIEAAQAQAETEKVKADAQDAVAEAQAERDKAIADSESAPDLNSNSGVNW